MKLPRWIFVVWVLICLLGAAAPVGAQSFNFNITLTGLSTDLLGDMFPFTAMGTGSVDIITGAIMFTAQTSEGINFTGTGTLGVGPTGIAFATTTFNSDSSTGYAIFNGSIDPMTGNLTGQITAGSPNRLGPPPNGFVFTTGTATLTPM